MRVLSYLFLLVSLPACSILSDTSRLTSHTQVLALASKVDHFYTWLGETQKTNRDYLSARRHYLNLEVGFRQALLYQQVYRELASGDELQQAMELLLADKSLHKKNDTLSDFLLLRHREQMKQLFRDSLRQDREER